MTKCDCLASIIRRPWPTGRGGGLSRYGKINKYFSLASSTVKQDMWVVNERLITAQIRHFLSARSSKRNRAQNS